MKFRWTLFAAVALLITGASVALAQQVVTIPQLQLVPLDSLRALDTLQNAASGKMKDKTAYWHGADANADTVAVTGVVTVAPRILTYTLARFNIYLQDTTTGQLWGGLNVLTDDTLSTALSTGITALDTGMVVTIVGRVVEYGSQNNSLTEMFAYKSGFFTQVTPIQILGYYNNSTLARPEAVPAAVDSFSVGTKPLPSRGEKYEGMNVIIRNITVVSVNTSSGAFTFQDSLGNQMSMYDGSGWYTVRGHKLTGSRYTPPPVGTKLKYIRGIIVTQSKTGTCGDYQIMPLYPGPQQRSGSPYPGDIAIDKYAPTITSIRRNPTPPHSTDAVAITWQAKDLNTSSPVDSCFLNYKLTVSGAWVKVKAATPTMVGADTLYSVIIPPAPKDSIASYYISAHSAGLYGVSPDPTIPLFYVVRDSGYTIYDVQYTPYTNGVPGLQYDTLTVSGIVISDTSSVKEFPTSGAQVGRPSLWIASKAGSWNSVCVWGATASVGVDSLKLGDSVSVTGVVYDYNGRTVIKVTSYTMRARGVTLPAATVVTTNPVGYQLSNPPVSGNSNYEHLEGTLLQLNNVYVKQRNADDVLNGTNSCFGEFFISSSSSGTGATAYGLRVDDNGLNSFYADTNSYYRTTKYNLDHSQTPNIKTTLITVGQKLSFIRGILDYAYSNYKLEPRTNADFGTITAVLYEDPNAIVTGYALDQNFPNPFNPTTNIRYAIPFAGRVTMKIYNVLGQVVETLIDQDQTQGSYVVSFNSARLSTGVYFYQLQAGDFNVVKKMLLLK